MQLGSSTEINGIPKGDSWPSLWVKQAPIWARNRGPDKKHWNLGAHPSSPSGKALSRLFFLFPQLSKCQKLIHGYITLELWGGTLTRTKWLHFMFLISMLWLCTSQVALIIYVSLLLLSPKVLSLSFDSQDNNFLPWAHSYATFHNQSNCWVGGALPSSSSGRLPMVGFSTSRKGLSSTLWWHVTTLRWTGATRCTLTLDITWLLSLIIHCLGLMTVLPYICNCKTGFVSNPLKAFKLQMIVRAPRSGTASSNYYPGPLDQRPSIWGLGEYVASTI